MVLPDNWEPLQAFLDLSTQWRVGSAGAVGLDYNVMFQMFRVRGVPRKRWADLLDDIQVMEGAALKTMSEDK